jgi:RHS repeat-associated protein
VEDEFHYDNLGNVVSHEDARGNTTTFSYVDNYSDSTNHYSYAYPTLVTNTEGHEVATLYNFNTGLPMSVFDARDLETEFTYDAMNRPLTITEPNGRVTSYTYTDSTPKVEEQVTVASGVVRKTETTFDKLNRPIQTELYDPAGNVFVDTEYDGVGLVKRISAPYRSGSPVWTETAYDVLGRPVTVTNPDSTIVNVAYSGNKVTTTDEAGVSRRQTFNGLGQLTKVEEPDPNSAGYLETSYSYYVFGPLAQVSQGSQTRTFTHDWLGRMTQEVHPETGTYNYSYDNGGLPLTRTDERVRVATYTYDDIGRLLTIVYTGDDGLTPGVSYTYDQNGFTGFLTEACVGEVSTTPTTTCGGEVTTSTFEYDDAGNLAEENVEFDGVTGTFTTGYTYDLDGRLLTVTYPSGRVVTQSYVNSGGIASDRTNTLTDSPTSATLVSSVTDNAAGAITARTLAGGIAETRNFNTRNQLTQITAAANSTTLLDISYGYGTSNDGRIRSRTDAIQPEHSAAYHFDEIGRLTAVGGGESSWAISWALDRYGNRTAQTPSGLASGRVGQQTTASWTNNKFSGYTYDEAGNLQADGTGTYFYDAESRIYKINSTDVLYAYDYAGRRIKRKIGSVTTYYVYGMTGLMSEFSTTSGASGAASSDRLQYRVGEQTGTAVMLMDSGGVPRENNRVFPFGEPWLLTTGSNNSEKFTTYQHDNDASTDLDYAMARYYASRSGRFMTPDPGHVGADVGDPQSWNAYAYTANDPVNRVDPTGTKYQICLDGIGCHDEEDQDYDLLYAQQHGRQGYHMPTPVMGTESDNGHVGFIYVSGQRVGEVRYTLTEAQRFGMEMNRRADAAQDLLLVAAGGSVALGVTGGLAAFYSGATAGSGLTTLGRIGIQQIVKPSPGQIAQMERVLAQQGRRAVEKALQSLERRLAEHLDKIKAAKDAGGYTSSMEREVQNFRQLIEAAKKVLGRR